MLVPMQAKKYAYKHGIGRHTDGGQKTNCLASLSGVL